MKCEQLDQNMEDCTCTYVGCSYKGNCCLCLKSHWRRKELPGCLFPPDVERTYDRSLRRFLEIYASELNR